jgi:hypothetical protein
MTLCHIVQVLFRIIFTSGQKVGLCVLDILSILVNAPNTTSKVCNVSMLHGFTDKTSHLLLVSTN